jgi:hypothetical protein
VRWSSAARPIIEQSIGTEPLPPLAGDLAWHAQLGRYAVVAQPLLARSTILARTTSRYGDVYSLRRASSSARSCSVSRITKGLVSAWCVLPGTEDLVISSRVAEKKVTEFMKRSTERAVLPDVRHQTSRYLNNRAENSHRPTGRRADQEGGEQRRWRHEPEPPAHREKRKNDRDDHRSKRHGDMETMRPAPEEPSPRADG